MKIRLVSRDGDPAEGVVVRVVPTRVQVRTPDGLLHTINRRNGAPCGQKGNYGVHPDDRHLLATMEETFKPEVDRRKSVGVASHWDV